MARTNEDGSRTQAASIKERPTIVILGMLVTAFLGGIGSYAFILRTVDARLAEQLKQCLATPECRLSLLPNQTSYEGSVVAYNLPKCPDGWKEYQPAHGKFLLGLAPNASEGLGGFGGSATVTLSVANMPQHDHGLVDQLDGQPLGSRGNYPIPVGASVASDTNRWEQGQTQPFSILPPFTVVRYCTPIDSVGR